MFQDKTHECVGFASVREKNRDTTDNSCQTNERKLSDGESQTTDYESRGIQTDTPENMIPKPATARTPREERSLLSFLRRVSPIVCAELEKARKSSAFDGYHADMGSEPGTDVAQQLHVFKPAFKEQEVACLSWNSTGGTIAAGYAVDDHDGWCHHLSGVALWYLGRVTGSAKPYRRLPTSSCISILAFHPTEKFLLAAGTYSGEILLWNLSLDTYTEPSRGTEVHDEAVTALSWICDAASPSVYVASCGRAGDVIVWQLQKGFTLTPEKKFEMKSGIMSASFLTSDLFVAALECGRIVLGSLQSNDTNPEIKTLMTHEGQPADVHCSNEILVLSCGFDGQIRFLKHLPDGETKFIFASSPADKACQAIRWSPRRSTCFAVASADNIYLYDLTHSTATDSPSSAIQISYGNVRTFEFCTAGPFIAAGSSEGNLHVWNLPAALVSANNVHDIRA